MKHVHGVAVTLQACKGLGITEYSNPYARDLHRYNGRVGSRLISEKVGRAFRVCVSIGEDFKMYKAKGVKVVVVALCHSPEDGKLVRRSQAWWVEVNGKEPEAEYVLESFTNGRDIKAKNQRAAFAMPQPADDYETASADWVTQEAYCANNGCIAVFVERGVLDTDKMKEEYSDMDTRQVLRQKKGNPLPIRFHWFRYLKSENSDPYVFEFRNMQKDAVDTHKLDADSEVGYDSDDLVDTDDEDMATTTSTESASEEATEAEESDASSSSGSDVRVTPSKRRVHASQSAKGRKHRRVDKLPNKVATKPLKWGPLSAEKGVSLDKDACHDEDDEEPLPTRPKAEIKTEARVKKEEEKLRPAGVKSAGDEEVYSVTRTQEKYSLRGKKANATMHQGKRAETGRASDQDDKDKQALADELRTIEIRQKLRVIKKRKEEAAKAK